MNLLISAPTLFILSIVNEYGCLKHYNFIKYKVFVMIFYFKNTAI